jgi:hypothetical protein
MAQDEINLISNLTPLERLAEVDDFVGIFNLLASDAGGFINAVDVPVDGGLLAGISSRASEILSNTQIAPVAPR